MEAHVEKSLACIDIIEKAYDSTYFENEQKSTVLLESFYKMADELKVNSTASSALKQDDLDETFTSEFTQQFTKEFGDELNTFRTQDSFESSSIPLLVHTIHTAGKVLPDQKSFLSTFKAFK